MNKKVDMFNPYDLSNKYTKMLKKFIIDHPIDDIDKIIDIKINKMNIILIREINEYNEKFAYINRIIRIINQYYRDFYKISENNSKLLYTGPLRKLLNIWNSIKEQKRCPL